MLPGQLCRMSGLRLFSVVSLQLVVSFSPMFVVTSTGWAPFSLLTTRAVFQRTCVCVFPYILFSLPPLGEFVIRLFLLSLPGERHFTFRVRLLPHLCGISLGCYCGLSHYLFLRVLSVNNKLKKERNNVRLGK